MNKLVCSDLSNIEGRVAAWVAGEQWKLDAFRAFDAGQGHDLYKLTYARSFNVSPESVDKEQRQVGKVQELALGYEGGVGAFITFADVYRVDIDDMAQKVLSVAPRDIVRDAGGAWDWAVKKHSTFGLSRDTYVGCDTVKRAWREAHPAIAQCWADLKLAVMRAIENNGSVHKVGPVTITRDKAWLKIVLPSGRTLSYPQPRIENGKISYLGVNQYSRKWGRLYTYGGKLFENICQAIARDILAWNMPGIVEAGYWINFTVHDEVVTTAPDEPQYNAEHLSSLLASNPPWAAGLPLAAKGFEDYVYHKE